MKLKYSIAPFVLLTLTGCASLVDQASQRMAANLSTAMLNHDDPQTVQQAMPAYLLLLDSLAEGDPDNTGTLLSASKLYASYASAFVDEPQRSRRLARRALDYAERALCLEAPELCDIRELRLDDLQAHLAALDANLQPTLYRFATAWAAWIQANRGDWNAIAEIPRLSAVFNHCLDVDETHEQGGAHLYLGVLNSQLPAAVGGKPEVGKQHFERAILISEGKNLMAKVLYAEHYARLVFDQPLHDQLLKEVLDDNPGHEGLVLSNVLARQRAQVLLQESNDFF